MKIPILKMMVDVVRLSNVLETIKLWIKQSELNGRYICVSNVHMCMEVFDDLKYRNVVNHADLTVADGKPIYWAQYIMGNHSAQQIRGEDLTLAICKEAEEEGFRIGFFGSTESALSGLSEQLHKMFPKINIVYSYSPPFREMTMEEDEAIVKNINIAQVQILFVGLGCPKQEKWMAEHKSNIHCTMLGVGAAFDFIAGNKKNAPRVLQIMGLEWFYRMVSEPKRLWKRYLKQNPRFIYYFTHQLLGKQYE